MTQLNDSQNSSIDPSAEFPGRSGANPGSAAQEYVFTPPSLPEESLNEIRAADQAGSPGAQPSSRARRSTLLTFFFLISVALLTYPLALVPKGILSNRFDFWFPVASVVLVILLILEMSKIWRRGVIQWSPGILDVPLCLFAVTIVCSWLFNPDRLVSLPHMLHWLGGIVLARWFMQLSGHVLFSRLFRSWAGLCSVLAVFAMWQARDGVQPYLTFGNSNFLACFLATGIPLAWCARETGRNSWWWNWGFPIIASILILSAIIVASSVGALLALAGTAFILLLTLVRKPIRVFIVLQACVLFLLILTRPWFPMIQQQIQTKMERDVRPAIWKGAIPMILQKPILGSGPGMFVYRFQGYRPHEYFLLPPAAPVTDHAHNLLLEMTTEFGLLGSAAFLIVILRLFRIARHVRARNDGYEWCVIGAFGALLIVLLHNLIDVNIYHRQMFTVFWLLVALIGQMYHSGHPQGVPIYKKYIAAVLTVCLGCFVSALIVFNVMRPLLADFYFRRALIARQLQQELPLRWNLIRSLRFNPYRLEARYLTAHSMLREPRSFYDAEKEFEILLDLAPAYSDAYRTLGWIHMVNGRLDQAEENLEKALLQNPGDHLAGFFREQTSILRQMPDSERMEILEKMRSIKGKLDQP